MQRFDGPVCYVQLTKMALHQGLLQPGMPIISTPQGLIAGLYISLLCYASVVFPVNCNNVLFKL